MSHFNLAASVDYFLNYFLMKACSSPSA